MTVGRLEREMTSSELTEWLVLMRLDHEDAEAARLGREMESGLEAERQRDSGR